MSTIIESIEQRQIRPVPSFRAGDRVRVHFQVIEGTRKRTQVFEGIVIKRQGSGARETFTVRKQSFGVGVERVFPLHSPKIEQLEIAARGAVRRAKLYYLRGRIGKRARVAERRWGIEDDVVLAPVAEAEATDAEGIAVSEAEVAMAEPEEVVEEEAAVEAAVETEVPQEEAVSEDPVEVEVPQEEAPAEAAEAEVPQEEPAAEEPPAEAPAQDPVEDEEQPDAKGT